MIRAWSSNRTKHDPIYWVMKTKQAHTHLSSLIYKYTHTPKKTISSCLALQTFGLRLISVYHLYECVCGARSTFISTCHMSAYRRLSYTGKRLKFTVCELDNYRSFSINQRTKWAIYTTAMLNYQRVDFDHPNHPWHLPGVPANMSGSEARQLMP